MMTAVLIDLEPETTVEMKDEVFALLNGNNETEHHVYNLPTSGDKSFGLKDGHRNVTAITQLENTNDIANFYQMKMSMDQHSIVRLNIICPSSSSERWHQMCKILLTPQYTWRVNNESPKENSKLYRRLVIEVKKFLSILPSFGEVGIMYSSIIPSQLFHHGYHTRNGGITQFPGMKSMNIVHTDKKKDPLVVVEENRRRLAHAAGFDPTRFHIGRAVHGTSVWVLGTPKPVDGCDIVVSNKPGHIIAAPGADCVVMVFADPQKQCCGVCHASWVGTIKRVAAETVCAMEREFGSQSRDILVVMGPSVNSCCLHLLNEETEQARAIDPSCVIHRQGDSKNYVDLQKLNRTLLENVGVLPDHIDDYSLTFCTSCNNSKFFSHQREGIPFGNQVGFIGIKGECY